MSDTKILQEYTISNLKKRNCYTTLHNKIKVTQLYDILRAFSKTKVHPYEKFTDTIQS